MLHMIMSAADDKMLFTPDNLAADLKPTRFQTLSYSHRFRAGVPHVSHRSTEQLPRIAPIGSIVIANRSRRTVCLAKGLIPPPRLIIDTIGGIGHHEVRWIFADQLGHIGSIGGVAAA